MNRIVPQDPQTPEEARTEFQELGQEIARINTECRDAKRAWPPDSPQYRALKSRALTKIKGIAQRRAVLTAFLRQTRMEVFELLQLQDGRLDLTTDEKLLRGTFKVLKELAKQEGIIITDLQQQVIDALQRRLSIG